VLGSATSKDIPAFNGGAHTRNTQCSFPMALIRALF
jgi:hypothetical protein